MTTKRAAIGMRLARTKRPSRSQPVKAVGGVIVLLIGAEARGKDALIAAARNRYAGDPRIEFPARLATRATDLDREHIAVSRRAFREIESNSGFVVSWQHFGARHGLTRGALQALEAGRVVVIAVPAEAVSDFEALGYRVETIVLQSGVDAARPFKGRSRAASPRQHTARPGGHHITHSGDIAHAVRRFHAVLDDVHRRVGAV